jgi:hypothetical protein
MPLLSGLDRREAWFEVQGDGNLKSAMGGEDRAIVGQPLHLVWKPGCRRTALNALHHQVPDHVGSSCRCHPADDLAVMAVQGKGNQHDLPIPAGEL